MNNVVIYIPSQNGKAEEAEHYASLFENCDVIGMDYTSTTPWEARVEFSKLFDSIGKSYKSVKIIGNSLGAFFAMHALSEKKIDTAFFISPIVNMQKLIEDMMKWENISEDALHKAGIIETSFGQTLSWEYLSYVKTQQISWAVPTHILYGENDNFTSLTTISEFAEQISATLTVMEKGEHWFHTAEQMKFLDNWIQELDLSRET